MADPRYRDALPRLARLRGPRGGGARGARGARPWGPGGRGRHGRARARLRRHLPARHRAPERAYRAGGAGAGPSGDERGGRARRLQRGFEAMGALARASHRRSTTGTPSDRGLRRGGGGGGGGAAHRATRSRASAIALALLGAGGLRAAFGSDGKSLQVGLAAAAGVRAARLAQAGARVPLEAAARGFAEATGGKLRRAGRCRAAIERTGSRRGPAASRRTARSRRPSAPGRPGPSRRPVVVHPCRSRRRRSGPSRPTASRRSSRSRTWSRTRCSTVRPRRRASRAWTPRRWRAREAIEVRSDRGLLESEAVLLDAGGEELARVEAALGSPERPLDEAGWRKVRELAGRPAGRGARRAGAARRPRCWSWRAAGLSSPTAEYDRARRTWPTATEGLRGRRGADSRRESNAKIRNPWG